MADGTLIEWTDATWNPITGCSVVSPGCTNCYAMRLAGTRLKHHPSRVGLTVNSKAGPVWTGEVRLNRQELHKPAEWKRPRRIFVCAHGDLFAEKVPDDWILDVLTVIASNPRHHFQVLTKRADRMRDVMSRPDLLEDIYANWSGFSGSPREVWSWPLHNLWLGVSVEDQRRADARIPDLLDTPAAVRWISAEPLLGAVDLLNVTGATSDTAALARNALNGSFWRPGANRVLNGPSSARLHWVVAGGESGRDARPMHPDWVRKLQRQCAAHRVPFFFKQWGEWCPAIADHNVSGDRMPETGEKFTWIGWDGKTKNPSAHGLLAPVMAVARMGKKQAGRRLDFVEHTNYPEVRHV